MPLPKNVTLSALRSAGISARSTTNGLKLQGVTREQASKAANVLTAWGYSFDGIRRWPIVDRATLRFTLPPIGGRI